MQFNWESLYHQSKERLITGWKFLRTQPRSFYYQWTARIIAAGAGAVFFLVFLVWIGLFGRLPRSAQFEQIKNPNASLIYGDNGELIGKYFIENRTNANYSEISPHVIEALVATEDVRFYQHHGIDLRSWVRVFFKTILLQDRGSGGGSTISQQLAKNLFPRKRYWLFSMPINKIREIITARRLEKYFTKEDILTLYLNTVSFGGTTYGIKAAAQQLFGKGPEKLSIEESALLVGMLKATTFYHPQRNAERAKERRNVVLHQMDKAGYLDSLVLDSLLELPLVYDYTPEGNQSGIATYFREHLRQELGDILDKINEDRDHPYNLYTDGLKIYTTIDPTIQSLAEIAVQEHMQRLQSDFDRHWSKRARPWEKSETFQNLWKELPRYQTLKNAGHSPKDIDSLLRQPVEMRLFTYEGAVDTLLSPYDSLRYAFALLQTGFLVADVHNGEVKAWIGGIDSRFFHYDHVLSHRQAGSLFKPFVYASALESGYAPCDYLDNQLITYPDFDNWTPENADGEYGGLYSLQGALANSVNTVTVALGYEIGVDSVRDLARRVGITSPIPRVPSIFLGTAEVSLWEIVQAYQTMANAGARRNLHYLVKVENAQGELLYEAPSAGGDQVIDPQTDAVLIHMLEKVTNRGTASSLRTVYGLNGPIAGKTGTTQDQTDGWFAGFTPGYVAAAWVGGESPLVRFRSLSQGQGSYMALPIWAKTFGKMYRYRKYQKDLGENFPEVPEEWAYDCPDFMEESEFAPWQEFLTGLFNPEDTSAVSDTLSRDELAKRRIHSRRRLAKETGLKALLNKIFKKN
ncbi:MAG: transglycosylase domain-containing protein [Saprospiraceae bacterium]